jgi:L-lactate utilization protein LutB
LEQPKLIQQTKERIDDSREWYKEQLAQRVTQSLQKNNMAGFYVRTKEEALQKILSLIPEGSLVCNGGSLTLDQIGIKDRMRSGNYLFKDRDKPGLTFADVDVIRREAFRADVYLSSANALTLDGKLVNIDGTGNRVAALAWGPSKVIVVVGINKIVKDVEAAIERTKSYAAVLHNRIGDRPVPCAQTGECADCHVPERACNLVLLIEYQREKDRITVIIVGEELGL